MRYGMARRAATPPSFSRARAVRGAPDAGAVYGLAFPVRRMAADWRFPPAFVRFRATMDNRLIHPPNTAHLDLSGQKAGARIGENAEKRNSSDFVVWKFIKKDENHAMQWELPVEIENAFEIDKSGLLLNENGAIMSYPGWAVECSAIIRSELGEPIDIHTGGIDHIPVHHTNEIAQSEVAFDKELSRFWIHNNFITVEGEKMSKSAGNFLTLTDLLAKGFSYMDFRMWVLQGHYQAERNFSLENLEHARNLLGKWRSVAALRHQGEDDQQIALFGDVKNSIIRHFSDNLDTSGGSMEIDKVMERIQQGTLDRADFDFSGFLEFVDDLTGLNLAESTPDLPKEAYDMIEKRLKVREEKNWGESDRLRDEISEKYGVVLSDAKDKTFWGYR
jgi:cysteinyl-tRNA synthetase